MIPIHNIPTKVLIKDLVEAAFDYAICSFALNTRVVDDRGGTISQRKNGNGMIMEKIQMELLKRCNDHE